MRKPLTEFFSYSAGNISQKAALFLLTPILARQLDAKGLGQWALIFGVNQFLALLADASLSKAVTRFAYDQQISRSRLIAIYNRGRLALSAAMLVLLFITLTLAWRAVTSDKLPKQPYLDLCILYGLCEAYVLGALSLFRAYRAPHWFLGVRVLQAAFLLVASSLLAPSHGVLGAASAVTLSSIIGAAAAWFALKTRGVPQGGMAPPSGDELFRPAASNKRIFFELLSYSSPLIFHDISWWIRNTSGPVLLARFATLGEIGGYALGALAMSAFSILLATVDATFAPYYYGWRSGGINWKGKTAACYQAILLLVSIFAALCIPFLNNLYCLLRPDLAHIASLTATILMSTVPSQTAYYFFIKPYFYNKRTNLVSKITVTFSGIGLIASLLLIQQLSYVGLACGTAAVFTAIALACLSTLDSFERTPYAGYQFHYCQGGMLVLAVSNIFALEHRISALAVAMLSAIFVALMLITFLKPVVSNCRLHLKSAPE